MSGKTKRRAAAQRRAALRRRYNAGWRPTKWMSRWASNTIRTVHDSYDVLFKKEEYPVEASFDDILVMYKLKSPTPDQETLIDHLGAGWPKRWPPRDVRRLLDPRISREQAPVSGRYVLNLDTETFFPNPQPIKTRSGRWSAKCPNIAGITSHQNLPRQPAKDTWQTARAAWLNNVAFDVEAVRRIIHRMMKQ